MGGARWSLVCAAAIAIPFVSACYGGARATRDANDAWRGRSRGAIEARWGTPAASSIDHDVTTLTWSHSHRHFELPSGRASLTIEDGGFDAEAELRPGSTWTTSTEVIARVDAADMILSVEGPSLRWGVPRDANLRWGLIMGMHAGLGRLDDTSTPLPGGGVYIGGMLSRTLGLVGTFSLVTGTDDDGAAMGFVWGLAPQWWLAARLWVRAGPAAVLAFDPGFENIGLEPGLTGGASYAIVRAGSFVLDLRLDVTTGTSVTLGTIGIGVNSN